MGKMNNILIGYINGDVSEEEYQKYVKKER